MNLAPKFPISRGVEDSFKMIGEVKDLVNFHLKNLLFTSPGEKISDPSYGIGIKRFLFEPLLPSTAVIIEDNIRTQVRSNLSYLNLKDVQVTLLEEDHQISVVIKYQVEGTKLVEVAEFDISLSATADAPSIY